MSEIMLHGVLNMPPELWNDASPIDVMQRHARYVQASKCIDELERELAAVTEQRDEARRLAEKYRNLSCDSQEEADETLLPWENNQPKPESKDPHRFCRGGGGNNFHCGCKYDG